MRIWREGDTSLEIAEYETVLAETSLVHEVSSDTWTQLGLAVTQTLSDPPELWRIKADKYVGIARLHTSGGERNLRIRPKLDVDIFFLADYAFEHRRDLLATRNLQAHMAVLREDPAAALIAWMIADIEAFARRHLRRQYVLRRETLEGTLRGTPLLDDYVSGHLAHGHAERMPSEFHELTADNLANQIIKATLREALRLTWALPLPAAQRILRRHANRVLPLFGSVAERRVSTADFNRLALRGSMRHYRPIIRKCRAFLEGLYIGEALGEHVQDAFLWDMNLLYQEALRGALAAWTGGRLDPARPARSRVTGPLLPRSRSSTVDPDYVLRAPAAGTLLLDAKYKDTQAALADDEVDVDVPSVGRIKVSRADIYQAVAYAQHDEYRGAQTGLIFPIALPAGHELPLRHRVEGFSQPVHVLFFDVGAGARSNLPTLYTQLDALTSTAPTSVQIAAAA